MDAPKIDLEQIRALVQIASEADITELAVESPTLKVSIKKAAAGQTEAPPAAGASAASHSPAVATAGVRAGAGPEAPAGDRLRPITAPMVGTFYRAPSPDVPPFVEEGDVVEAGQTVCIIEAMKLFNEIQSDVAGRVLKVLVENGAPVEYGQPLLSIEPLAP